MRRIRWDYLLLALVSAGVWAQPANIPAQPSQAGTRNAQAIPAPETRLSEKDKALACTAGNVTSQDAEVISKVGGSVKPPRLTSQVPASFSDQALRMAKKMPPRAFHAISTITLIVDEQGNPKNVCVQRPAGYGLDGQAVKAVKKYRFEPATKDGVPVPVRIQVQVSFQLY